MFKNSIKTNQNIGDVIKYRSAKIPFLFDDIKVVIGSEEDIFEEKYVTGLLPNNRVVKFKMSSLEFK